MTRPRSPLGGRNVDIGFLANLGDREHHRLSEYIERRSGIYIPPSKRALLEARLRRRLRVLEIATFEEYCDRAFAFELGPEELAAMVEAVTTNKTDFFREPFHFTHLARHVLPELLASGASPLREVRIWSAACSTGEEPYTLAMVVSEFLEQHLGTRFSILATDINAAVLAEGQRGVYPDSRIEPIPEAMRRKYLRSSRNRAARLVRVTPDLRRLVTFRELNLLDANYDVGEPMDAIFCRNVLIYFRREVQILVCDHLTSHLRQGGYLFLGQSETLQGASTPLRAVAPTIYRKV